MSFARYLYLIVAAIVLCALLVAGLAEGKNSGPVEGESHLIPSWASAAPMYCIIAAVGVIWLGWYHLKLARSITSMANRLNNHHNPHTPSPGNRGLKPLNKAIKHRLQDYNQHINQLQQQINNLQIKIQLTQRQKKHTQAIIYSIHDAVIVIDEFEKLLLANQAAGKLFAFDFKNAQHKPIKDLIDHNKKQFVDFICRGRRARVRDTKTEIQFIENGQPKTYHCIVSAVHDENRQPCGVVAVLHDITYQKHIQQAKTDFVNHVSHELKTPLASITAYAEMLADDEANDQQMVKEFCSVIQNQARRLNRLIEDILNISRIESGLIKVEKKPISLTILIQEQLQMIKSYANEKNIEISCPRPIVFDQVYADKDMLSQVIINLLANAVKYTPAGGSVKIQTQVDEISKQVSVTVTDTGVGIPQDELPNVFDKFYRVRANKNQAQGTGLGLNLVKQIIEKVHRGTVFVTSKPGQGSTFGFKLPLAARVPVQT